MKSAGKGTTRSAKSTTATGKKSRGLTEEEKAAMREYVQELKGGKVDGEEAVLAKLAVMPEPDRTLGKRLHAIIMASAPDLTPRTWYGMPAYSKDGDVVCWYQNAAKFKARYGTLGFSDKANVDEGAMWPVAYALTKLTPAEEAKIAELVKRAVR